MLMELSRKPVLLSALRLQNCNGSMELWNQSVKYMPFYAKGVMNLCFVV